MSLADGLDKIFRNWEEYQHDYPAHFKVEKLQIVDDIDNDPVSEEEIAVSDRKALAQWLKEDDDNTSSGSRAPSLKLLLICTHDTYEADVEVSEEDAKSVTEAFQVARLPLAALIEYSESSVSSAKASSWYIRSDGTTSLLSRYYLCAIDYCITWAFDHATKDTRGALFYCNSRRGRFARTSFVKALISGRRHIDQPMLLGLIGSKVSLERIERLQSRYVDQMWTIRHSTGLFDWSRDTGELVEVDTSKVEYGTISRELASLLARVSKHQFQLHMIQSFAVLMLQEHTKTRQKSSSGPDTADLTKAEEVKEAIEIFKERTELVLGDNKNTMEDLRNMMSAIYNLIAQKDSNIGLRLANHSRTLAVESKRDSSSMKTIAAVTMAFLPGTFVSSFFAMPMFDWNKPPGSNVNTHTFWIYWTVTIPLTVSVFLLWWAWFRLKTVRETREDKLLADLDRFDEKHNNGNSGSDYDSDNGTDSRSRPQSTLSSHSAERSGNIWHRFRAMYHGRHTLHRKDTERSSESEVQGHGQIKRDWDDMPEEVVLRRRHDSPAASIVSRSPEVTATPSRPPTIASISSRNSTTLPLPHPVASRQPSATSLGLPIAPRSSTAE